MSASGCSRDERGRHAHDRSPRPADSHRRPRRVGSRRRRLDQEQHGRIAFIRGEEHQGGNIYTAASDGSDVQKLTDTGFEHDPVWSPDGEWLAFTSQREATPGVYVMKADGSRVRPSSRDRWSESVLVVRRPTTRIREHQAAAPDDDPRRRLEPARGTSLQHQFRELRESGLVPGRAANRVQRLLGRTDVSKRRLRRQHRWHRPLARVQPQRGAPDPETWSPAWSPTGEQLAADAFTWNGIYVGPVGGAPRRIESTGLRPNWSPDGSRIVFARPIELSSRILRILTRCAPMEPTSSG